jgi:DNA adenine methylase
VNFFVDLADWCCDKRLPNVLRWAGGKYYLAKTLCKLIPDHEVYVEPFCGSASLFFAKKPSKVEVLADINKDLIDFFNTIKRVNSLDEIIKFGWYPNRERFYELLKCLNENICLSNDPLFKAYAFLYVNKFGYGSKIGAPSYVPSIEWQKCKGKDLCEIEHLYKRFNEVKERLNNAIILCQDFRETIKQYDSPNTFFYLDPPYETERNIEYFGFDVKPEDVYDAVKNIKGKFLLTYNDSEKIRTLFKDYHILKIQTKMEIGKEYHGHKTFPQLIIMNYTPPLQN